MGPMTGRAAGYCAASTRRATRTPVPGRGFGAGFGGGGRGWRHWFYATGLPGWARAGFTPPVLESGTRGEKEVLKARADALQSELDGIKRRLEKIGTEEK
jgi:hypothetical protein